MNTTDQNITPATGAGSKTLKAEKAKKIAGKTAQFAAAAGLGVAGTMAANAMPANEDDLAEEIIDDTAGNASAHAHHSDADTETEVEPSEDIIAEAATDFDPNDIMIEADDVVVDSDVKLEADHGDVAMVEIEPITGEHVDMMIAEDVDSILFDDTDSDEFYADIDNSIDDIDLADDILA